MSFSRRQHDFKSLVALLSGLLERIFQTSSQLRSLGLENSVQSL